MPLSQKIRKNHLLAARLLTDKNGKNHIHGMHRARWIFVALIFGIATSVATANDQQSTSVAAASCECRSPWREYTRKPTPEVELLFAAARHADEETFSRLISKIPDIQEYAVHDEPLLVALLNPVAGLGSDRPNKSVRWEQSPKEQEDLRARHAATLPAKTRMLVLALQHGASVSDTTYYSRTPPLHLALVFGTPEMVRLLLKHGADPNQIGGNDNRTPLEFAVDHEFFMRMTYLPYLVGPQDRTDMMLALIAAGAKRPYLRIDEDSERKGERPAADYLLWPALAELTRGSEIMDAMEKLGTTPAFEDVGATLSPLAHAARAGNVGGVKWLKSKLPRTVSDQNRYGLGEKKYDLWLEAAMWALYPSRESLTAPKQTEEILAELIVPDTRWGQPVHKVDSERNAMLPHADDRAPRTGHSLLHHLVLTNHGLWVKKAIQMGAQLDIRTDEDGAGTPLAEAVLAGNAEMVRQLLAAGADPLAAAKPQDSALYQAISPHASSFAMELDEKFLLSTAPARVEILQALLSALTPQQKLALARNAPPPLERAFDHNGEVDAKIVRLLLADLPTAQVTSDMLLSAMRHTDKSLAAELLERGVELGKAKEPGEETSSPLVLALAIHWNRKDLVPGLLKAGADPNLEYKGISPVNWAILHGDMGLLDMLLAHGGSITPQPGGDTARASALDFAVASGNDAVLQRIGVLWNMDVSQACLVTPDLLLRAVLDSSDSYWKGLVDRGLGKASAQTCKDLASMPERLIHAAIADRPILYVGWRQQQLLQRLGYLWSIALANGQLSAAKADALLVMARDVQRDDLATALHALGVHDAQKEKPRHMPIDLKPSTQDRALMKTLTGHYYLDGVREVGSELLLKPNGKFEFMLAYGAVDQLAQGTWSVFGEKVIFRTADSEPAAPWVPYKLLPEDASSATGDADAISIKVVYEGQAVPGVAVTALGCVAPQSARGKTARTGWMGVLPGQLCQIVLHHPDINNGRAFVYDNGNSSSASAKRHFVFEMSPPLEQQAKFNTEMDVKNGKLLWKLSGRPVRYVRGK